MGLEPGTGQVGAWGLPRQRGPYPRLPGRELWGNVRVSMPCRDAARVTTPTALRARYRRGDVNGRTTEQWRALFEDMARLLPVHRDWESVTAREVPEREGRPIVGVDLGGGRAWSAAVALYANGRVEARAVAPGLPDLDEQERRDRVPPGTYAKLYDMGQLEIAEGLKVQPPAVLWAMIMET